MLHSSHPRRLWVLICSCLAFAIMSRAQTEVSYDFADSSQWVRLDTVVMRNGAALASTLGASSWSNAAGPDEAPGRVNLTVTAAQEFTYYSTKPITPGNGIVVSYDFLATEFTAGGVSRTVIGLGVIDPTTTAVAADLNLVPSITAPQARLIKLAANTTASFEARNTDNYDADTEVALVGGTWYRFTATFIPNAAQSTYHIASELRDLGTGAVVASATGDTKTASTATFFSGGAPLNFYVGILAQGQYGGAAAIDNFTIAAVPPPVAPSITTQPQSQAVAEGQDATFSVAAGGTAPLSYQWKKGGADLTDGGRISGSTTATLTLTGAEAADAGSYTVVVTNTVGSATSNAATLAVHPPEPPAITTQPASQVTTDGMTVTFSVAASGTGPFTYEWRKEAAVLADGGRLSGATTASLTITGAVAADAGSYSVVVSNAVGTATSDAATLTVNLPEPPAITAQPASRSTPEGVDVTFTVEASGTGPLSYQWKKGAEVLGDGGRISGSTTATLALAAPQAADAGSYTVVVTNAVGTATSEAAILTVTAALAPSAPVATAATAVTNTSFTANWNSVLYATGYRLDVATDAGFGSFLSGYENRDVGNATSWEVAGLSGSTTYHYRVRAYNSTATSGNSGTILVTTAANVPAAITSSSSTIFTVGVPCSFTVTAGGSPAPTFSASGLPAWATLNATTGVIRGTPPAGTDGSSFVVKITADNGTTPSLQDLTLVVKAIPAITTPLLVSTLAGQAGSAGSIDDTGAAARFNFLLGAAVDASGNVYIADEANHTIRKVTSAGVVTTLAGQAGVAGSAEGTGTAASFNHPSGIAAGSGGTLYVADTLNHTIRKITSAGVVSTVAGLAGSAGNADGTGDAARFSAPQGVALDAAGANLYVADTENHTIRKIVLATGAVTTVAGSAGQAGSTDGTGTAARFDAPSGVAVNASGIFVADTDNNAIRVVSPTGVVTTLAGLAGSSGAADETGTAARFNQPSAVALDSSGILYVLDAGNHTVRKIAVSSGAVTTLAGLAGTSGSADGAGATARFKGPAGLAVNSTGVYVADTENHTLRRGDSANAPVIQVQPKSQSVMDGVGVQFSVTATAKPAPAYQWYFNSTAIAGATANTYAIASAHPADAGSYTVAVSNAVGSVTSAAATLAVNVPAEGDRHEGAGGGGAPSGWWFLALALLGLARRFTARRCRGDRA